jgi:hypothetical protein
LTGVEVDEDEAEKVGGLGLRLNRALPELEGPEPAEVLLLMAMGWRICPLDETE